MKALRITKVNQSWVLALGHSGVLSAIVTSIDIPGRQNEHAELQMRGLDSQTDTHLGWNAVELKLGDRVTVEVIDECQGDKPDSVENRKLMYEIEHRKQYVRDEARKLGWTIIEAPDAEQSTPPNPHSPSAQGAGGC